MKKLMFLSLVLLIVLTLTCSVFAVTPSFPTVSGTTGAAVSFHNSITIQPKIAIEVTGDPYGKTQATDMKKITSGSNVNLGNQAPVIGNDWQYQARHYNVRVWTNKKCTVFINRTNGNVPNHTADSPIKVTFIQDSSSTQPWNLTRALNFGTVTPIWSGLDPTTGAGQDIGTFEVYLCYSWKAAPQEYNFDLIFGAYQE